MHKTVSKGAQVKESKVKVNTDIRVIDVALYLLDHGSFKEEHLPYIQQMTNDAQEQEIKDLKRLDRADDTYYKYEHLRKTLAVLVAITLIAGAVNIFMFIKIFM